MDDDFTINFNFLFDDVDMNKQFPPFFHHFTEKNETELADVT